MKAKRAKSRTKPCKREIQLIAGTWKKDHFAFGGSLLKGSHPKKKRPFHQKLPLHLVLRSSRATRTDSLLRHSKSVAKALAEQAAKQHIQIFETSNAGNHIHLVIRAPSRDLLNAFIRGITARISQIVLGEDKVKRTHSFWDERPFSRILSWGRDLKNVRQYLALNSTEIVGLGRDATRRMFGDIQEALDAGLMPISRSLSATGFS